jgi:putative ABC transport system permease protein
MNWLELTTDCVATLTLNKLRSGLAVLGIIIGIGSVIALISLGQGSQKAVEQQIQALGSNLLTIIPRGIGSGPVRGAIGGGTTLTLADAQAIESSRTVTTVAAVSPEYSGRK